MNEPITSAADDYEREKQRAKIADANEVAQYLEGLHDFAEPRDQPWLERAAMFLRLMQ